MSPILVAKAFVGLFFAVLFLQSGLDKVSDRKGNLEWLTSHFANSPLKRFVSLLLATITVLELTAGATCLIGAGILVTSKSSNILFFGLSTACLSLLCLFTGQRIAKDYPGAATLATYFGVAILGLWLTAITPL